MQKRKPTGPSKPASHKKPREPIGTALRVTVSVLALVGAATAVTARATADNIPFQDPNANGYIGFCNADGKQVTSGKIGDAPFAALAVASSPAPAGYAAGYGKAQLNVTVQGVFGVSVPVSSHVSLSAALEVPWGYFPHQTVGLTALAGVAFRF